jgi:urea transporter
VSRVTLSGLKLGAVAVAACAAGIVVASYFFAGDPCKSSSRIGLLYLSPVLFSVAASIFVAQRGNRTLIVLTAGALTVVVCGALLGVAAVMRSGSACYT